MDEFNIKSSGDDCCLTFYDRDPEDSFLAISSYRIRVTRSDLLATAKIYADAPDVHPASWLRELAQKWMGWESRLHWESGSGLRLSAENDRRGHVLIRVELQAGWYDNDWNLRAAVTVDAGQLEGLAKHATMFFGKQG